MAKQVDQPVLILGSGINGAALARELLLNDVPVCLVERSDLASGTTAYSSRLVHGGLRYLEYGEFDLVRESLQERTLWLKLAPHFVKPLRLFIPIEQRFGGLWASTMRVIGWERPGSTSVRGLYAISAGLRLYDTYARDPDLERYKVRRANEPGLPKVDAKYHWLCSYMDAQILYPERFTVALIEDARQIARERGLDFQVWTYHQARLQDKTATIYSTGSPETVAASITPAAVINATGAWVDHTLEALHIASEKLMGGTKGSHFITSHAGLHNILDGQAMYVAAADGRPVFVLPFADGTSLIGTTDERYSGDPGDVVASQAELEYLVQAVNDLFPSISLTMADVNLHYSGVRPLPRSDSSKTAGITRRHWLEENKSAAVPFYSVIGGKLTTCRSLAEDGAAALLKRLDLKVLTNSRQRPLPGAEDYPADAAQLQQEYTRLAQSVQLKPEQIEHLWRLVGTRLRSILQTPGDWSVALPNVGIPEVFVRWSIDHETVFHVEDLVERRLMLVYHPQLTKSTVLRLAQILVETGRLSQDQAVAEAQAMILRLQTRFGRKLPD